MSISEVLLSEFDREMANTRKILECVPEDKFAWKPHEKSFTLGRLAGHLAEMPLWVTVIIKGPAKKPSNSISKAELLEAFNQGIASAREAIAGASDDHLRETLGINTPFAMPRVALLRLRVMSHMIHHRGQLSVYLRLLDVSVPGVYGPSADET